MDNRDFSNIGDKIRNTVEDALNSMDYQQLNQKINQTVDMAMHEAKRQYQNYQNYQQNYQYRGNVPKQPQKQVRRQPAVRPQVLRVKEKGKYSGSLMMTLGVVNGLFWTIPVIGGIGLLANADKIPADAVSAVIGMLVVGTGLVLGSVVATFLGASWKKRYRCFKLYLKILDGREFCTVRELAEKTNTSVKVVCRNLRSMIKARMFFDGFLDEQGTCLIVTKNAYAQYRQALESRKQREAEEIRMQEERASETEVDKMIRKGNEYIDCIREANDAIPGEVISAKLDRLELIIRKIFESVKQHPEQMDEMDRFMEYYLPTTQKLVNAYKEFDALPVKGENVMNSMNEIEATLDTISHAFEQLLDDLFQNTAFDISSDISVLQTMLAREGYKEKDFK